MKIRFSAPSKTFLSGEYAVLRGGPAVILNTGPRFELRATRGHETAVHGIPKGSPAARWLNERSPLVQDWTIQFIDPHEGQGGFGASSAQFLFVHALTTLLQISVRQAVAGLDVETLLRDFKSLSPGQPSGADLMAQTVGQVAKFAVDRARAEPWPFAELDFAIVRTSCKVPTHDHLNALNREPLQALVAPAEACGKSFGGASAEAFLEDIKVYAQTLRAMGLQTDETLQKIRFFEIQPWCKLAKGCGALGADTLLLFFAHADRFAAEEAIAASHLLRVAGREDLSDGLAMDWSWN